MKKYILVVVVLFLTSCSNDDSNSVDSTLIGTWQLTSLSVNDPIIMDGVATTNLTANASDSQIIFTNNSFGSINYVAGLGFYSQTTNQNTEYSITSAMESFTFEFLTNANIVTIKKDDDETITLSLNQNTLTLKVENAVVTGNLDTNTIQYHTATYVFIKQ